MSARVVWTGEHEFTLDDVSYRSTGRQTAPGQLVVLKNRRQIEFYEALIEETKPRSIVELGIYGGGSTALLAQLARPEKLVALDIRQECPPLEQFIDARGLGGTVVPYFGVDQADGPRLDEIMDRELGGAPVDLVIDDASHFDGHTRASFNRLFPHLRPDGMYVIEDWAWAHHHEPHPEPAYQEVTPLSALVCELVLATACRPKVITEVRVDQAGATVRRGPAALRSDRFDISARFDPVGREMVDRLSQVRSLPAGWAVQSAGAR
jgi:predicted O-methyltransferase YrrM